MADELIDIVDKDNNVIRSAMKAEAHNYGFLHRTILAEVINPKGEWLLVKQAGDRQDAGQYVSPVGGHIRSGESEENALKREAFEEVGFKDFKFKYIGRAIFNRQVSGRKENHLFILYEIYSGQTPKLNHESVGFKWFEPVQLKKEMEKNPKLFGAAWNFVIKKFYPGIFIQK